MLFQQDSNLTDEQIVGELFKNFVDTDDPAFLSSPESDFEFVPPPPSLPSMSTTHSPLPEETYGVVPLSSGPSPPQQPENLYPRLTKKARNTPDIERWTPYNPPVRQYFALYDPSTEEVGSTIDVRTKIDKVDQREHYSAADEAYILYRQNQFQLDVDMFGTLGNYSSNPPTPSASASAPVTSSAPLFVDVGGMLVPVECLYYHIYSVKQHKGIPVESSTEPEALVDLVQLGGPRNRKDFQLPGLCPIVQGRATYGRLQFRAATPNNARVHPDQPNPNQQYYRIVLSLVAKTATSLNFIFSKISPCFMVRGQNPGKFNQTSAAAGVATPSKPLTPPTTIIPKQEYLYPPSPFPPQHQTYDPNSPQQSLSPNRGLSPVPPNGTLSPNPNSNYPPPNTTSYQNPPTSVPLYQVNPNPAQLPALVAHAPTSPNPVPNQSIRGVKRPSMLGDGEGWTNDQYGNVYTTGKVGINTTDPTEALSVQGNILVTGDVLKPSDQRIKDNITPLSTTSQLENVERLKLYEYDLKHQIGPDGQPVRERGVLAQELQAVLPSAVRVLKNVTLADGTVMPELLVVQDRALLFENIGATQELSRSVREQKSRLDALSDSFANGMHEINVGTKKAVKAMAHMMRFMMTEKKRNYENTCFFLSIFGLGPAWTMYLLGFFCPILWFFGLFYIASVVSVKKTAGFVHFGTLVVFVIYAGLILGWDLSPKTKIIALLATEYLGFVVWVTFGIYWCRKMNERELSVTDDIIEEYENANRDSISLLLPPEAVNSSGGWNNKQLEYGQRRTKQRP